MNMKLGSLFDGIGGFPLVASWYGITPVWASEIEPAPISITRRHFPHMLHLGDVTKINGAEIEPVDVATFGSPCQDLSVAGKRAGLKHEDKGDEETTRSGLLMEAVRIFKEMRAATNGMYPRIIVWENVPGAFSSNEGEDFRIVLEEICRIADPGISIPRYADGWTDAGLIVGNGFSVGWRKLDAQFWGVPQRRKRIYLVADFGGYGAAEILFKPESWRRHTSAGKAPWERFAGAVAGGAGNADTCLTAWDVESRRIHDESGKWPALYSGAGGGRGYVARSLTARNDGSPCIDRGPEIVIHPQICGTLCASGAGLSRPAGQCNEPDLCIVTAGFKGKASGTAGGIGCCEGVSATLQAGQESHVLTFQNTGQGWWNQEDIAQCLRTPCGGDSTKANLVCTTYQKVAGCLSPGAHPGSYNGQDAYSDMLVAGVDCRNGTEDDICATLQAHSKGGYSINTLHPVRIGRAVRRLTPLECDRLMGYPDDWTKYGHDGKIISDTARYKADGNSVALCCVDYVMSGIADIMDGTAGRE